MKQIAYEYQTDRAHANCNAGDLDRIIESYALEGWELFRTDIIQSYALLWLFFRRPRKNKPKL